MDQHNFQKGNLVISPISETEKYYKVRILGRGSFGRVYLVHLHPTKEKNCNNEKSTEFPSKSEAANVQRNHCESENEFAAKIQGFDGGPVLNRREASIMRQLVNPEVRHKFKFMHMVLM